MRFTLARGSADTVAFEGGESVPFDRDAIATLPWPAGARAATFLVEGLAGDGTGEDVTVSVTALPR